MVCRSPLKQNTSDHQSLHCLAWRTYPCCWGNVLSFGGFPGEESCSSVPVLEDSDDVFSCSRNWSSILCCSKRFSKRSMRLLSSLFVEEVSEEVTSLEEVARTS